MKRDTRKKGNDGEDTACRFLEDKGCRIIERNFRSRRGEIDIVQPPDILDRENMAGKAPAQIQFRVHEGEEGVVHGGGDAGSSRQGVTSSFVR